MDYVTDSSVWISLKDGGFLEDALKLPFNWSVPDVVLEEELEDPSGTWLESQGVHRCELPGSQVGKVVQMAARYRNPSRCDLFALVQAKEGGRVLLSDDGPLRKAACTEGVEVHGTLWVLDQMLTYGVIDKPRAAKGLRLMLKKGSRFPEREVESRLRLWEDEG